MKQTWSPSSPAAASARPDHRRGFTFAEILVAMTIAGFVLAGATSMFIMFARTNMTMAARSEYDRMMRTAVQKISEDTRMAATVTATSKTSVTLTMPAGSTPQLVYYTYDAADDELYRSEDANADVMLLRDCTYFTAGASGDAVTYDIRFSKSIGGQTIDLAREVTISKRN